MPKPEKQYTVTNNKQDAVHYITLQDGRVLDVTVPDHNREAAVYYLQKAGLDKDNEEMIDLLMHENLEEYGAYHHVRNQVTDVARHLGDGHGELKKKIKDFMDTSEFSSQEDFLQELKGIAEAAENSGEAEEKARRLRMYQAAIAILMRRRMVRMARRRKAAAEKMLKEMMKPKQQPEKKAAEPAEVTRITDIEELKKEFKDWVFAADEEESEKGRDAEAVMKEKAEVFKAGIAAKRTPAMTMMEAALDDARNENAVLRVDDSDENRLSYLKSLYKLRQAVSMYCRYKATELKSDRAKQRYQAAKKLAAFTEEQISRTENTLKEKNIAFEDDRSVGVQAELLAENLESLKKHFGEKSHGAVLAKNLRSGLAVLKDTENKNASVRKLQKAKAVVYYGLSAVENPGEFRAAMKSGLSKNDLEDLAGKLVRNRKLEQSSASEYLSMKSEELLKQPVKQKETAVLM